MYQLAISRDFIAQHYLIGGDWGRENDKHSHHYKVEVLLESDELDQHGYLVDIVDLENAINAVIASFQEQTLNDLQAFQGLNPSLERFARIFYLALQDRLHNTSMQLNVKLWENSSDWAAYHE